MPFFRFSFLDKSSIKKYIDIFPSQKSYRQATPKIASNVSSAISLFTGLATHRAQSGSLFLFSRYFSYEGSTEMTWFLDFIFAD